MLILNKFFVSGENTTVYSKIPWSKNSNYIKTNHLIWTVIQLTDFYMLLPSTEKYHSTMHT